MKMTASFNSFMTNTVNINQTRLRQLDKSVTAIFNALNDDAQIGDKIRGYDPQGSWAHETIIKPPDDVEFDADFLLLMDELADWSPKRYLTEVHTALARNGTYKDMVKPPKDRCVRVVYAGDYHVDIVPFVTLSDGRQVIVNGSTDKWEDTDPAGFTAWMKDKSDITSENLKRVIRLLKHLRDHRDHFRRTRSVLITAMVGNRVEAIKKLYDPGYYSDLPTAFFHLVADLNDWLQDNETMPSIVDPSGATDPYGNPITFDHRWDQDIYAAFREKIKTIAENTKTAYEDDTSIEHSLELWQKVFGPDYKEPPSPGSGGTSSAVGAGVSAVASGRGG